MIGTVTAADLPELLPLMRAYCDFYEVAPSDEALLAMARELIDDPAKEGVQLIARSEDGRAIGFATIFWTWSTLTASRVAVMNDLFLDPAARGGGAAEQLIDACAERAREHGATELAWTTGHDNERAQRLYDRIGAQRDPRWLDYSLPVS